MEVNVKNGSASITRPELWCDYLSFLRFKHDNKVLRELKERVKWHLVEIISTHGRVKPFGGLEFRDPKAQVSWGKQALGGRR